MRGLIAGVAAFIALFVLAILFVYPWIFDTVHGAFDDQDLGTLAALGACVLATGPIYVGAALTGLIVAALTDRGY